MPRTEPADERSDGQSQRPHIAARIEDRYHRALSRVLRSRHWRPRVLPYTGYGLAGERGSVRIMARVLLTPPRRPEGVDAAFERRGYRSFLSAPAPGERVDVTVGGVSTPLEADRGGYLNARITADLEPGDHEVTYRVATGECVAGHVVVVAPGERVGVVSDIDDTVMVTALPRPLVAAWNTFVRHPSARLPVRGMSDLYRVIREAHPDAPFVYLSTGAWNTAATLRRFLATNGYPDGPLLLTDWGPTNSGWFRSGQVHKNTELDRLVRDFPDVRWILIGDDGQHDPDIYARAADLHRAHIKAIAIRQLTPGQQLLAHGTTAAHHSARAAELGVDGVEGAPEPTSDGDSAPGAALQRIHPEVVSAPDGHGLAVALGDILQRN